MKSQKRQIDLLKEEMGPIQALARQKLVTEPRKLALERTIIQAEGELLKLETTLMRSRQEHGRTNVMIVELDTRRVTEITAELQQMQMKLQSAWLKVDTSSQLLKVSEARAPMILASQGGTSEFNRLRYSVVRKIGGKTVEITADEGTVLQPGDTVRVELAAREPEGPTMPARSGGIPIPPVWNPAPSPAALR